MNLLLCRCFQLLYIEKHPEEASEDSVGPLPRRNPSLLNHGFPLSVSALVSFRRAPFRGLFPGAKVRIKPSFFQSSCPGPCQSKNHQGLETVAVLYTTFMINLS